jgi:5-formyltetrahydrofolate cyclo-ligase
MAKSKQELRLQLRTARSSIMNITRDQAAENLCSNTSQLPYFSSANRVALYWAHDDEISTTPLIHSILEQGKECFLPVLLLDPHQKLAFASYTFETPLIKNRYGILEPELTFSSITRLIDLDIIFVPLVGFDNTGRRLGRGGGYYDATFAELHKSNTSKWPKLVGLSYNCQRVEEVPADTWDWQLDAVVTESDVFNFRSSTR